MQQTGLFDEKERGRYVRQIHAIKSDLCGYPERAAPTGESWPDIFHTHVELKEKIQHQKSFGSRRFGAGQGHRQRQTTSDERRTTSDEVAR